MSRYSQDLLQQARHLANLDPKRPKQASLRRSVSTAYYALFHFLIEETTGLIIGTGSRVAPLRQLAGRAFVHGKMKTLCSQFVKPKQDHKLLRNLPFPFTVAMNPELEAVALAFVALQDDRHSADYDMATSWTRAQAVQAADMAEDAMKNWDKLSSTNPDLKHLFALCLALWPSLSSH